MARQCPQCQKPLEQKSYRGGIHVDACLWCKGVWFDAGELDTYRQAVWQGTEREGRGPSAFQVMADHPDKLTCPRCNTKTLVNGTIRNIRVQECETCHGLYVS